MLKFSTLPCLHISQQENVQLLFSDLVPEQRRDFSELISPFSLSPLFTKLFISSEESIIFL